jgi:hypothetical protein
MRARLMVAAPKLGHYSAPVDVDLSQADIDRVIGWFGEGSIVLLDEPAPEAIEPEAVEAPKRKPRR